MNCEGCEYDVVEGLRGTGHLAQTEQVQLATHLLEFTEPTANAHEALALSFRSPLMETLYCMFFCSLTPITLVDLD